MGGGLAVRINDDNNSSRESNIPDLFFCFSCFFFVFVFFCFRVFFFCLVRSFFFCGIVIIIVTLYHYFHVAYIVT